jgi:Rrf2 family protein
MFVTRQADYAIRCILFLSGSPGRVVSASEISESMSIPRVFLAKILQRLTKKKFIASTKGARGGFQLLKKPEEMSVLEVIEAAQGPSAANACAIDASVCTLSGSCAVHPLWIEIREIVEEKLRTETFATLLRKS